MKKVLILCTGNSCRSQMAEGLLRDITNNTIEVYSAGTHPEPVNPYAIKAMQQIDIDISSHQSNHLDNYRSIYFDFVITVCSNAKERCPHFSNCDMLMHESFRDPANAEGTELQQLAVYIEVRDQLKEYLKKFYHDFLVA